MPPGIAVPARGHAHLPDRSILRRDPQVRGDCGGGTTHFPEMCEKLPPLGLRDINDKWLADHDGPPGAEQPLGFRVDFPDAALGIKGQVTHGRLLMKLRKALVGNLERRVSPCEFLILDLEEGPLLFHLREQCRRCAGAVFLNLLRSGRDGRPSRSSDLPIFRLAVAFAPLIGRRFHLRSLAVAHVLHGEQHPIVPTLPRCEAAGV